jgi:two-component system LytT family response regulator
MQQRLELLRDTFKGEGVRKIALPMSDGLLFVEVADIVLLEAEGAYTTVFLQNGSKLVVSKKLKFFEDVLMNRPSFFRVHRSNIINMNYIKKYVRGSSTLVMDNNMNIPVARDKKQEFEGALKELRFSI